VKRFYAAIFTVLGLSILIFLLSFVYLDKNKRKVYYYTISVSGHDTGVVKVEKFVTEDKLIYKSASNTPLDELYTESRTKMVFDKHYNLENYVKERTANGATELACIENKKDAASYIARLNSRFAFLGLVPLQKNTLVFEEHSPLTYIPIIENYDFRRGRSQGFSAISCLSNWELPPMKRYITLTSIKNEYIKVGRRKIKTENLLLKIKNFPQGAVWVAKSDKSIIKVEIPSIGLKISRTFEPIDIAAGKQAASDQNKGFASKEVSFINNKIRFAGTLTAPVGKTHNPAVLLVWGNGPEDRNCRGLFKELAEYLSANGFSVLRFDKRGIGSSDGNYNSYSESDELDDLKKAVEFLSKQEEVDPGKIFVAAHSTGARPGINLTVENIGIQGLVLIAPVAYSRYSDSKQLSWYPNSSEYKKWTSDYNKSITASTAETKKLALEAKGNWIYMMFRRCFVKRIKEEASLSCEDLIKQMTIPVLILQGNKDEIVPAEAATELDSIFQNSSKSRHTLIFFGYLGHFFGKIVNDGTQRIYYELDKDAAGSLLNWLVPLASEAEKAAQTS